MFSKVNFHFLVCALMLLSQIAYSQVYIQGEATHISRWKNLSNQDQKELERKALVAAIDKYAASMNDAETALYRKKRHDLLVDSHLFVNNSQTIDLFYAKDDDLHTLVLRAVLNENALSGLLFGDEVELPITGVLFVARRVVEERKFMDEKYGHSESGLISQDNRTESGSSSSSLSKNGAEYSESAGSSISKNESSYSKSSGEILSKENKLVRDVSSPENAKSAMLQILGTYGVEAYEYVDILGECGGATIEMILGEFVANDSLSASTRKAIFKASKDCELDVFVIGAADDSREMTDSVTGNKTVITSMRTKVFSLKGRLPKVIGSVGPVQYSGQGRNMSEARNNAILKASEEAAKAIAAILVVNQ